jgi:hypothetical protein
VGVFLDVVLAGFLAVLGCVIEMAVSCVRMMTGFFVISGFMVLCRGEMMFGCLLVMFCCFSMMFSGFLGHGSTGSFLRGYRPFTVKIQVGCDGAIKHQ